MEIVIDIDDWMYSEILKGIKYQGLEHNIKNGTPLVISEDGTLTITVEDATKIGRVLVQDSKHNGGLFYADCD